MTADAAHPAASEAITPVALSFRKSRRSSPPSCPFCRSLFLLFISGFDAMHSPSQIKTLTDFRSAF
jgi:hypothetical protein